MSEFGRLLPRGEDTDLLCVEVSALAQATVPAALPRVSCDGWQQEQEQEQRPEKRFPLSSADQAHEDFLTSMLLKTDAYRPLHTSLRCMEDPDFLDMRGAVVNWFAKVSVSYDFANETVVAALSHFDRYVSLTVTPVSDHMLLQLAAYVALLVASKMGETCPLRMKSLANLTGRMFTPLQVKRLELDMISKLNFRLAPPSADETLQCLSSLLRSSSSSYRQGDSYPSVDVVPHVEALSTGSYYLKKARARTCWFRHPPYTLAVAALATAYNSMGLGELRRRLLRECDARARLVTGRGIDIHGVAACADAMASDERASAAVAAAASLKARARGGGGGAVSPVCGGGSGSEDAVKEGWGSPTGVAQGAAELLQKAAFAAVGVRNAAGGGGGGGGVPLVEDFSPPRTFSPCGDVPTKAAASHVVTGRRVVRRVSSSPRASAPRPRVSTSPRNISAPLGAAAAATAAAARRVSVSTSPLDVERIAVAAVAPRRVTVDSQPYRETTEPRDAPVRRRISGGEGGKKRRLHQSAGSCFEPCARRRRSVEGTATAMVGHRVHAGLGGGGGHAGGGAEGSHLHQDLNAAREHGQGRCYAHPPASSGPQQQQQQQQQQQPLSSVSV